LEVPRKQREATETSADRAPAYPPVEIMVRFLLDGEPEVECGGLAPWLVAQTLVRAAEALDPDNEEMEPYEEPPIEEE
jgi:hypothetical protein